jgi:hypothetical protein
MSRGCPGRCGCAGGCAGALGASSISNQPPAKPNTGSKSYDEMSFQEKQDWLAWAADTWDWLARNVFDRHPKDQQRLQENLTAYTNALTSRDCRHVQFLLQRTGTVALAPVAGYYGGQPLGGWATFAARDDARDKYAALRILLPQCAAGLPPGTTPPPSNGPGVECPSSVEINNTIALLMANRPVGRDALEWIASGCIAQSVIQQAVNQYGTALYARGGALDPSQGYVTIPGMGTGFTFDPMTLAMIGGGALLVVLLASSGSSRRR